MRRFAGQCAAAPVACKVTQQVDLLLRWPVIRLHLLHAVAVAVAGVLWCSSQMAIKVPLPVMRLNLYKSISMQPEAHALNPLLLRLLQLLLLHPSLLLLQSAKATAAAAASWQQAGAAAGQRRCKDRHVLHACVPLLYRTAEQCGSRLQRDITGLQCDCHGGKPPLQLQPGVELAAMFVIAAAAAA